ncbi:MAG: sulfite exporter TauE/SafE family protein [Pseudomonadota bacterium]
MDAMLLVTVGLLAGIWNAIAGGATLFSFPALMALGLSPMVANATNFVALFPANLAALPAYGPELRAVGRALLPILGTSCLGAAAGSALLLISDPALFRVLIPFLLLLATLLFAFGDRLRAGLIALAGEARGAHIAFAALFLTSIYGGYFGAGLGIILLGIAQILGYEDFHTANAIKNLTATGFVLVSIAVFGLGGLIAWPEALTMMAGSTMGGYLGGRIAKRVNQRLLRSAVIAFGLILTAVYILDVFGR